MTEIIQFARDTALSFWPTPPEVADDLVIPALCPGYGFGEACGDVPQVRILEPSAGEGHLARVARRHLPCAHITAVEPDPTRAATLRALPNVVDEGVESYLPARLRALPEVVDEVVESTLEDYLASVGVSALLGDWQPFDLVFMNPPFTLPGRPEVWAEHVLAV